MSEMLPPPELGPPPTHIAEQLPPQSEPSDRIRSILDAVGREHVPLGLDHEALEKDIEKSVGHYLAAVERQSDQPRRDRIKHLNQVKNAIRRTAELMRTLPREEKLWEVEYVLPQMEDIAFRCDSLVSDLELEIAWGPDYEEERKAGKPTKITTDIYRQRSPIEWLAGRYLPKVYKTHFKERPPATRGGRYIQFVQQVCTECDIPKKRKPYSNDTILKALTDGQSGRLRRGKSGLSRRKTKV
jgi:hypothetical protein